MQLLVLRGDPLRNQLVRNGARQASCTTVQEIKNWSYKASCLSLILDQDSRAKVQSSNQCAACWSPSLLHMHDQKRFSVHMVPSHSSDRQRPSACTKSSVPCCVMLSHDRYEGLLSGVTQGFYTKGPPDDAAHKFLLQVTALNSCR